MGLLTCPAGGLSPLISKFCSGFLSYHPWPVHYLSLPHNFFPAYVIMLAKALVIMKLHHWTRNKAEPQGSVSLKYCLPRTQASLPSEPFICSLPIARFLGPIPSEQRPISNFLCPRSLETSSVFPFPFSLRLAGGNQKPVIIKARIG